MRRIRDSWSCWWFQVTIISEYWFSYSNRISNYILIGYDDVLWLTIIVSAIGGPWWSCYVLISPNCGDDFAPPGARCLHRLSGRDSWQQIWLVSWAMLILFNVPKCAKNIWTFAAESPTSLLLWDFYRFVRFDLEKPWKSGQQSKATNQNKWVMDLCKDLPCQHRGCSLATPKAKVCWLVISGFKIVQTCIVHWIILIICVYAYWIAYMYMVIYVSIHIHITYIYI